MKHSGNWTLAVWVATALVLGVLDVFVVVWTPAERDYKSPWAVSIITFFFLVVLYVLFTELMRRKLIAEMRQPDASATVLDKPGTVDDRSPPPLRVEVSTPEEILTGSLRERPMAARARRLFDQSIAIHRRHLYLLVVANVLIAGIALLLQQPFPLSGTPAMILIGAPLALRFMGMLGSGTSRLTINYVAWLGLHGAWAVATCFVAGSYIVSALAGMLRIGDASRSQIALAMLSGVALFVEVRRVSVAQRRLYREVAAEPAIRLLFLWVFGDGTRITSLLSGVSAVWRCVGPLQFLQGGGMIGMGADVFRHFRGRGSRLIADSNQEVDARIAAFKWAPHRWWAMYATNTLLCSDRSWRYALKRLLDTDVVLMDLCGFSSVNAGCVYEIGQIIDRIATSRFVLLIDESTDMKALRDTLQSAWAQMDFASPNRRPDRAAVRLFRCDPEQDDKGHPLVGAMKRNADCLFELLCTEVDDSLEKTARNMAEAAGTDAKA